MELMPKCLLENSRKRLVSNAKAGNILNGFIIDIEDNFITVDVGFACRILKRNLPDYFVKSIDDHFKFYTPIKLLRGTQLLLPIIEFSFIDYFVRTEITNF